jgi:hypothetical protein
LTKKEKQEGWQLLFDGETMTGWRLIFTNALPQQGWRVEEGCLIVEHSDGGESRNGGDMVTTKEYSNFDFTFDFKIGDDNTQGNSGVKYFVNEALRDGDRHHGYGPEYQVINDVRVRGSLKGGKTAGLYEMIDAPSTKKLNPPGEWNTGRIVSKNNHVEHWLNGELLFSYVLNSAEYKAMLQETKWKDLEGFAAQAKGPILIQDHGNMVLYKNLKIKEL